MTTAPHPRPSVARLRGPAELAALLPHLCGFVPTDSLVVVALHGARRRVGLTMRVDLPPAAHEEPLVADVAERLLRTGARAALVVVCTGQPDDDDLPRARLVRRLLRRLGRAGIPACDALLVRDGRWWSYTCRGLCCPPEGTPLPPDGGSPGLSMVAADAVARGVAVLAGRDELVAQLAPPSPDDDVLAALSAAHARLRADTAARGRAAAGRAGLAAWRAALVTSPPRVPPLHELADLVVALDDVLVRDEVVTWLLDDADALLWLLLALARRTPRPYDAQLCTLLGWTAHSRGDGALANVALDRALTSDGGCTLALLARQALDGQVPPAQVRSLMTESRRVLRATHPWTAP